MTVKRTAAIIFDIGKITQARNIIECEILSRQQFFKLIHDLVLSTQVLDDFFFQVDSRIFTYNTHKHVYRKITLITSFSDIVLCCLSRKSKSLPSQYSNTVQNLDGDTTVFTKITQRNTQYALLNVNKYT